MISEIAGCPTSFSLLDFDKFIVHSGENRKELTQIIKDAGLDKIKNRFNVWRMCLDIIRFESSWEQKVQELRDTRKTYEQLEAKHIKKMESKKSLPAEIQPSVSSKNPLAQRIISKPSAPVIVGPADDKFLHEQILKDVQRTYQEKEFFTNNYVSDLLTKVLFIWSKENPDISYVQGINQLGASVIYVYFMSAVDKNKKYKEYEGVIEELKEKYILANSREYAEADIYAVFTRLMDSGHKEMFRLESETKISRNPKSKINSPILERITKLSDITLKSVDLQLFRHIKLMDVQMRTFLLRWIRCIHTREFQLAESFPIWDNILLDYHEASKTGDLQFIDFTSLAMLIYLRDLALTKEKSYEVLQLYQKYPKVQGQYLKQLIKLAWSVKQIVLNPPIHQNQVQKKKKNLFFLEKGFTELIKKEQIEQNKNRVRMSQLIIDRDVDKEINPIFYKKPANTHHQQLRSVEQKSTSKQLTQNTKDKATSLNDDNAVKEKQQQQTKPVTNSNPSVNIGTGNAHSTNNPTTKVAETKKLESSQAGITLSHKEWKELESTLKKSIEENTDIESKALSLKVLKILQNKEQEEIKRINQNKSYLPSEQQQLQYPQIT